MKVTGAVGLIIAFATFAVFARAAPPVMDDANRSFGEGHYAEAAAQYEALLARHGSSAPLLFDLGNAYLRDAKPVKAMLAYERAELVAPRDEAIAKNLAVARSAANAVDERGVVARVEARTFPMTTWTWLAVGGFWAMVAAVAAAAFTKRRRAWFVAVAACGSITAAASLVALSVASRDLDRALVMQPAPVLVSPFESAQSDFVLDPGASVEMMRTHDAYVFVRDARGRTGWVERAEVEPIVPHSS